MKKLPLVMMLAASVYAVSGTVAYADGNGATAQPASTTTPTLQIPSDTPEDAAMARYFYQQIVLTNRSGSEINRVIAQVVPFNPQFEMAWEKYQAELVKKNTELNTQLTNQAKAKTKDFTPSNNTIEELLKEIKKVPAYSAMPDETLKPVITEELKQQAASILETGLWKQQFLETLTPLAFMDLDVYHRIQAHARQYALQHALMDRDVEIADSLSMSSAAGLKYTNSRNGILKTTLPGAFASFSAGMANLNAFITVNPHYQSVCRSDCFKFTGNSIGLGVVSSYAFAPQSHLTGLLALRYHRVKTDGADSVRQNGFEADLLLKADHTFGTGPVSATTDAHYQVDYMRFSKHGAKTLTQKAGVGLDANFAIASQFKVGAVLGLNYVHNKQPKFASFWLLPEAAKTPWLNVFKKSDWQSRVGVQAQYNALKNLSVQAGVYHDTYYGAGMNANSYQLDVNYQF